MAPPSLEGKGVGGLGHRGFWENMKQPWEAGGAEGALEEIYSLFLIAYCLFNFF